MKQLEWILTAIALLNGCSANMAMNGQNGPDVAVVKQQESRQEIERLVGSPIEITSLQNGHKICIYQFNAKTNPDYVLAAGHATADLLTFGFWEVIGTPIEGYKGKQRRASIEYDTQDKVVGFALES